MTLTVWQALHDDLKPGVQPDQKTYAVPFQGRTILLPIRTLADGRGVASLILNQASFAVLDALADDLAAKIAPFNPDVIIGVPTLGLPLAEAVARRLGHTRMLPLGNSRKFWYDDALSVDMASITSPASGKRLYLDPRMQPLLAGRVAVVDDVLSTGTSIAAVLGLLELVQTTPVVIGAAMLQGTSWQARVGPCPVEGGFATPILQKTANGWVAP
ncbi:phosphoribosyltransferase [Pseudorhodobacter sp. W20_MBD10_FR17]|uniref:phosphoribosyltransferase n=1 Tax=Pseudorhodobacter sp. W20_MBD10_FR17 TaxID=3240266 RepID=UPI003F9604F9